MIIGITGLNGSGKGEVANFLLEQGFEYLSLSDIIREELVQRNMEIDRENLIDVGNKLRKKFGPGELAERALSKLENGNPYVVDSIRNPGEITTLRMMPNFYLVGVIAPLEMRFERVRIRKRDKDALTLKEFKEIEKIDGLSKSSTGQQTFKCIKKAEIIIVNDSNLEVLKEKMAKVLLDLSLRETKRLKKQLLETTIKM